MTAILDAIGYDTWILHALIWLPVAGGAAVLAGPERLAKFTAFWTSLAVFVLSLGLWWTFDPSRADFQLASTTPWIQSWGASYSIGIDGISLLLVLLTTLLSPVAILGSFRHIDRHEKAFYALMLLLETGILGVFLALDLFLFYVFWEITLIPMYFIIGVWGHEARIYAAIKFFLFTAAGSLLMLVAILYLYFKTSAVTGDYTFAYTALLNVSLTLREQLWLFAAFALAFAIKVPVFPLHTWLPLAHVEAPTAGSVILAAVLLKLGAYGFLRFLLPFFPAASAHPTVVAVMLLLGVIGVIYAAWVAAVQPDAKKLVAYTSVAHMGFVVLGTFALTVAGIQGGLIVMVSHGISTGALFLLVGMLYERRHTRLIEEFGGLAAVAPWFATAFMITALTSIGVPGTSGFIGEFLALVGTFERHPVVALVAVTGVIFAAYYMLPMVQRIWFNALEREENREVRDLSRREIAVLAPLVALMVFIGVNPDPFLGRMEPSVEAVVERVERGAAGAAATLSRSSAASERASGQAGEVASPPHGITERAGAKGGETTPGVRRQAGGGGEGTRARNRSPAHDLGGRAGGR